MAERIQLKLANPVEFGSTTVTELNFRELQLGDIEDFKFGQEFQLSGGDVIRLAGKLSGEKDAVIRRLRGEDMMEVMSLIGSFFEGSLGTGEKP